MDFLIGADPEVFVGDDQQVRSIIGKIGGTKDFPLALPIGDGFAVQEDNVALEFNIPASRSRAEFVRNITLATGFLEDHVRSQHGLHFVKQSAISFPQEELNDPRALVFGCDPDFNAWTRARNPRPSAKDKNLRSCGGHLHVGVDGVDCIAGVKACDLFAGVPSVLMDSGEDRRKLYGGPGAFRVKPYGFEYRTLSNFWIFSPRTIEWAYNAVDRALEAVASGLDVDAEKDSIMDAIVNNNKDAARYLVDKYSIGVVYD